MRSLSVYVQAGERARFVWRRRRRNPPGIAQARAKPVWPIRTACNRQSGERRDL